MHPRRDPVELPSPPRVRGRFRPVHGCFDGVHDGAARANPRGGPRRTGIFPHSRCLQGHPQLSGPVSVRLDREAVPLLLRLQALARLLTREAFNPLEADRVRGSRDRKDLSANA